jgi:tetratricopeptide (TPR) repeat protein
MGARARARRATRNLAALTLAALTLAAFTAAGCAPQVSASFVSAKNAGDRAYSSGRYAEAATAYLSASTEANRVRDRDEALYLAARAHARARNWNEARIMFDRLIAASPRSEQGHRATFDRADLELASGNTELGYAQLERALFAYPSDGLARRALERYIAYLDQMKGGALDWIRTSLPKLATTELDESVRYALAVHLEEATDLEGAREIFVTTAAAHPYPKGALFDDSLWHASLLDEKLGRPAQAIDDLRDMLAVREVATMTGSYERPRFSAAQFRIAVLYRDALGDAEQAQRAFHTVYTDHKTSLLRDDALWEEAKLAQKGGNPRAACRLAATLAREFPSSRYSACTGIVCAVPIAPPPPAPCHDYLKITD